MIYEIFNGRLERPDQLQNTARIPSLLAGDYKEFLENLNVKDAAEKEKFFVRLTEQVSSLPPAAAKYKVLPALVQSLEYGGGTAKTLTPMLKIAQALSESEFHHTVVPIISKLFANTDRAMRMPLLEQVVIIIIIIILLY
ncbi:hypothetical protein T492DRAFT_529653 [Pavlovales sp. CCMP2436]|nr:hypothetical protein T492DRAFT_529653 [Pavlovales sp. CCMP2436]